MLWYLCLMWLQQLSWTTCLKWEAIGVKAYGKTSTWSMAGTTFFSPVAMFGFVCLCLVLVWSSGFAFGYLLLLFPAKDPWLSFKTLLQLWLPCSWCQSWCSNYYGAYFPDSGPAVHHWSLKVLLPMLVQLSSIGHYKLLSWFCTSCPPLVIPSSLPLFTENAKQFTSTYGIEELMLWFWQHSHYHICYHSALI